MAFPDGLPLVTLELQFDTPPDGGVAFGSVRVTSPQALIGPPDDSIVPIIDQVVRISATGAGSIRLPVVDDPGWTPQDWAYSITANINGTTAIRGTVQLFTGETTVNLADRIQLTTSVIVPGVTYATLAQLTSGLAGKSDLDHTHAPGDHTHVIGDVTNLQTQLDGKAATVHGHTIDDVADLQVQLDGKQPAGVYLVPDDITNLVSYETLTETVSDYLPKIAPVVTDSTLTVVRTAGGAARWRTTGSALDIDVVGDVVESRFANQNFTGTQTGLRRMRSDGNTLAGVTEFGSTPYLAEQAIDASTGVARLGAKNSAGNVRVAGHLDISTAPTTGTWTVGDVVLTRIGQFRCTVAGTPGTWVPMWREQALDKGYVAWNGDPGQSVQAGTIIPTGGLSFVFRLRALGALISRVQMHCSTTATGITNAWCTLHDDNGLILNGNAKSDANQNTSFNSGGMKNFTFIAPQVVTPGAFYRARVWFTTGTSLPTISRMCNSNTAIINPDVTGTAASTPYGWASADGGLTDLASAPDQIGNLTGANTAWWMGAK